MHPECVIHSSTLTKDVRWGETSIPSPPAGIRSQGTPCATTENPWSTFAPTKDLEEAGLASTDNSQLVKSIGVLRVAAGERLLSCPRPGDSLDTGGGTRWPAAKSRRSLKPRLRPGPRTAQSAELPPIAGE